MKIELYFVTESREHNWNQWQDVPWSRMYRDEEAARSKARSHSEYLSTHNRASKTAYVIQFTLEVREKDIVDLFCAIADTARASKNLIFLFLSSSSSKLLAAYRLVAVNYDVKDILEDENGSQR